MNNMKVYSRITTLLDYKKQTKNNKTTKKGLFSSHLRHFSIFHIAILTKRSTFVPIKGPCSSTDRIDVSYTLDRGSIPLRGTNIPFEYDNGTPCWNTSMEYHIGIIH